MSPPLNLQNGMKLDDIGRSSRGAVSPVKEAHACKPDVRGSNTGREKRLYGQRPCRRSLKSQARGSDLTGLEGHQRRERYVLSVHEGKGRRGKVLDKFIVDLLARLPDVGDPRTVADEYAGRGGNLAHHIRAAGALEHQMVVPIVFMLQSYDGCLDAPNSDFGDVRANALECWRVLGRIRQTSGSGKRDQFFEGGVDDAGAKIISVDDVLAHFGSVWIRTGFYRPTFAAGRIGLHRRG